MARIKVTADNLKAEAYAILENYSVDLLTRMNEATKVAAKWGVSLLKERASSAGFGGKKYKNCFASQLKRGTRFGDLYELFCRAPYYRLAHLLEWGHRVVDKNGKSTGSRTNEYHHWTTVQEELDQWLAIRVMSDIKKLNGE